MVQLAVHATRPRCRESIPKCAAGETYCAVLQWFRVCAVDMYEIRIVDIVPSFADGLVPRFHWQRCYYAAPRVHSGRPVD